MTNSLKRLHEVSLKLSDFCTKNPAIGREIGVHALFMSGVNSAIGRVNMAERKARIAAIQAGQTPTYATRRPLRNTPKFEKPPYLKRWGDK